MDKLLIAATGIAYAAARGATSTPDAAFTPDLLAAGAFGIYGYHRFTDGFEKFALISHAAATANNAGAYVAKDTDYNGSQIVFYLGANSSNKQALNAASQPRQSSQIQLTGIKRVVGTPYVAGVKGAWTITFPAVQSPGTSFDEYVLHITKNPNTKYVQSWTFSVTGIFANATALVTAFKNIIAARFADLGFDAPYVASGTATLILTAVNYGDTFIFGSDGFAYPIAVSNSTVMVPGSGMLYQVSKAEKNTGGERGWNDQIDRRMPGIDQLALEAQYDIYLIDYVNIKKNVDEQDDTFSNQNTLTLYIPQGSSSALTLELIMSTLKLPITPQLPADSGGTTTSTTTVAPAT